MLAHLISFLLLGFVRLLTGAQARWYGCPPTAEQRIYFANHQSHADLVLIWAALPPELRAITRPIAAKDYWTTSRFKRWLTAQVFRAVYVERSASQANALQGASAELATSTESAVQPASDPLAPLDAALRAGDSLILFPEGTRGHADTPGPFKSGLYALAQRFPQVVLVPVWINNVQRVMPKGEVVPVPILCSVTFGEPISLGTTEERRAFLDRARLAVMALQTA